jgi:hypothetical protein
LGEVPLLQRPLLSLDDQDRCARQHEEVLLLGLPVLGPGRLARIDDADRDAEHREERLGLVFVVAREWDAVPLTRLLEAAGVADVDDESALALRNKPASVSASSASGITARGYVGKR